MKNETSITLFADLSQEAQDSARRIARIQSGKLDGLALGKFTIRQDWRGFYATNGDCSTGFHATEERAIEAGEHLSAAYSAETKAEIGAWYDSKTFHGD